MPENGALTFYHVVNSEIDFLTILVEAESHIVVKSLLHNNLTCARISVRQILDHTSTICGWQEDSITYISSVQDAEASGEDCLLLDDLDDVTDEILFVCRSTQSDKAMHDFAKELGSFILKISEMDISVTNHQGPRFIIAPSTTFTKLPDSIRALFSTYLAGPISPPSDSTGVSKLNDSDSKQLLSIYDKSALKKLDKEVSDPVIREDIDHLHKLNILRRKYQADWFNDAGIYNHYSGSSSAAGVTVLDDGSLSCQIPPEVTETLAQSVPARQKKIFNGRKSSVDTKIDPVHWADIGGLDRIRRDILSVIQLPIQHPDLFPSNFPRSKCILLFGPPGIVLFHIYFSTV